MFLSTIQFCNQENTSVQSHFPLSLFTKHHKFPLQSIAKTRKLEFTKIWAPSYTTKFTLHFQKETKNLNSAKSEFLHQSTTYNSSFPGWMHANASTKTIINCSCTNNTSMDSGSNFRSSMSGSSGLNDSWALPMRLVKIASGHGRPVCGFVRLLKKPGGGWGIDGCWRAT